MHGFYYSFFICYLNSNLIAMRNIVTNQDMVCEMNSDCVSRSVDIEQDIHLACQKAFSLF